MRRLAIALGGLLLSAVGLLALGARGRPRPGDAADRRPGRHRRGQRAGRRRGRRRHDQGHRSGRDRRRAGAHRPDEQQGRRRLAGAHGPAGRGHPRRQVPVAIWVGPSGSRALGLTGQLLGAAPVTAMAPATRIGDFGDPLPVRGFELDFGERGRPAAGADHGPDGGPRAQRAAPDHLRPGRPRASQHAARARRPRVPGQDPEHRRGAARGKARSSRCSWPSPASTSCRCCPG